jgi:hypothetical protein
MESRHLFGLFLFGILMQVENVHTEGYNDGVSSSRTLPPDQFDDRTLLDTFGEAAKHYLTQKVIPETDAQCRWDWRSVRCEPFCECTFKPKRGDYHLGRSCRASHKEGCDPIDSVPDSNSLQVIIQRMVTGSRKAVDTAEQTVRKSYLTIQTRVCADMHEVKCTENGLPVIAWQERLFCRHKISRCEIINPPRDSLGLDYEHDIPVAADGMMVRQ